MILAGEILINDVPCIKSGERFDVNVVIRTRGRTRRFVSRGGEKLQSAIDHFQLNLQGVVALDVGASTGGFTHCLLKNEAQTVYAVDVGFNQLDYQLRNDPRVVVLEELHANEIPNRTFNPKPNFVTVDLSFISVRQVLSAILSVLDSPHSGFILVKPQFELERVAVEEGGVVNSEADRLRAVSLVEEALRSSGERVVEAFPSALKGAKSGNQEYFVYFTS